MLFLPKVHRGEGNLLDHPITSAVTSQRRAIKLMFKLLKHRCVFHISGAAFHRLISHGVRALVPCPWEWDSCGSWQPGPMGPCAWGDAAGAGDSLAGPARAGDSVGTGVVDKTATAARLFPCRLGQGWGLAHTVNPKPCSFSLQSFCLDSRFPFSVPHQWIFQKLM